MNEILIFWHRIEKNIDNFFDFSKGNMPLRVGKYYLFSLLLLSASAIFLEVLSLVTGNHDLRLGASFLMWLVVTNLIIIPGAIIISIDKISGLDLLDNYRDSFLEQSKNLVNEWNGIVICFLAAIVSLLLFHSINLLVQEKE